MHTLTGHAGSVECLAWSPSEKGVLVTASTDRCGVRVCASACVPFLSLSLSLSLSLYPCVRLSVRLPVCVLACVRVCACVCAFVTLRATGACGSGR